MPTGFHRVQLEAGEYTLILDDVDPPHERCSFGLERTFRVPENDTPEAWAHALRRGLGIPGACYRAPGHHRYILSAREAGEYIITIVERIDFREYAPDATEGLCGEYELIVHPGDHWCPSE